ncbi:S8 family peptidase [Xanthomonas arboricola]|uniref:S8 family peptidase n=1 Tax=Xanthomonas arboricola TaxID=56448 RepID=UPI0015E37545|nr:S8 family peptidase [Xanthomonas arboricola]
MAKSRSAFQRSAVAVAAVKLKPVALAKSNRPKQLLDQRRLPSMGTARPAEVLLQVTQDSLSDLANRISEADGTVPLKETIDRKTKKSIKVPNPSQLRCDVGVVDEVILWDEERRLVVPLDQMSAWFKKEGTPLSLIVRLFQFEGSEAKRLQDSELKTLSSEMGSLGCLIELDDDEIGEAFQQSVLLVRWKRSTTKDQAPDSSGWIRALPKIVARLSESPIVRTIHVPARISSSDTPPPRPSVRKATSIPTPTNGAFYPVVGVIDGGICPTLSNWLEPSAKYLLPADGDPTHGTSIAGLLVMGQQLNGADVCPEPDGCSVVDICLMPKDDRDTFRKYYDDSSSLFRKIEAAIVDAKSAHDARVFNFSFNIDVPTTSDTDYCYETEWLDRIAWKHDVVFVVSAGNLPGGSNRTEWPEDHVRALSILAQRLPIDDLIRAPAHSLANVSVSAVNPPNVSGYVPGALTSYSRRGPSNFGGLKPDVAHFGGCAGSPSGLTSLIHGGSTKDISGTSFAAPLVAKTMARYCQLIDGSISRELMIGLVIHHSKLPALYAKPPLSDQAKDLVGVGVPLPAEQSLAGKDSSITLVFEATLLKGQRLEFKFAWPKSLVKAGKCRGRGRMTLVSKPAVDSGNGDEFARTQLDGHVNQLDLRGKPKGGAFTIGLPDAIRGKNSKAKESVLRRHQLKWGPVKVYDFESPSGVGESSEWRLLVESLERAEGETPKGGIRFAALLTIEDNKDKEPVFTELRQDLVSRSIQLDDLRVINRTRARRGNGGSKR